MAGCGSDDGAPTLGQSCGLATPCSGFLLCLEGSCVERPFPQAPPSDGDVLDTHEGSSDAESPVADTAPGPDGAGLGTGEGDTSQGEASDGADDLGPEVVDAETADVDADDAVLDAGDGGDSGNAQTYEVLVGEHVALDHPSDDALTPQLGQGPVAQLFLPADGRITAIEILATSYAGGAGACGRYVPALWQGHASGQFFVEPDWQGPEVQLTGMAQPQEIALSGAPRSAAGHVRLGLIFTGLCEGAARQPLVVVDDSGVLEHTWLWARLGQSATWIAGATLQLSGRWAIRARLAITL